MIVTGTGHRPDKVGGYKPTTYPYLVRVATLALQQLPERPEKVRVGGAQGWDQALFEAATDLGLRTHLYVPFVGQPLRWPPAAQAHWNKQLLRADEVTILDWRLVVDTGTSIGLLNSRNIAMLEDGVTDVLALHDGSKGGTNNTVMAAKKRNIPVWNAWPLYLSNLGALQAPA